MSDEMTNDDPPKTRAEKELADLFDELDTLMKSNELGVALSARGINIALALTALSGFRAYLEGDKIRAIDDLGTAVEEIASRASVPE